MYPIPLCGVGGALLSGKIAAPAVNEYPLSVSGELIDWVALLAGLARIGFGNLGCTPARGHWLDTSIVPVVK